VGHVSPALLWVGSICWRLPAVTRIFTQRPYIARHSGLRLSLDSRRAGARTLANPCGTGLLCMQAQHPCTVHVTRAACAGTAAMCATALWRASGALTRAPPPAGTTRRTCARTSAPTWASRAACCCCSRWARAASRWTACSRRPRAGERERASGTTGLLLRPVGARGCTADRSLKATRGGRAMVASW